MRPENITTLLAITTMGFLLGSCDSLDSGDSSGSRGSAPSQGSTPSQGSAPSPASGGSPQNLNPGSVLGTNGCPANFVRVPGNPNYITEDFCVMKYEAKAQNISNDTYDEDGDVGHLSSNPSASHKPASVPQGLPWAYVSRDVAVLECQSLGGGYDLMSNDAWQTVARNIESVGVNWSGGSVGSGCLLQGNTGFNTSCGYDGGNPEDGLSPNQKAKHTLSNGEEIWNMAGNVLEWVKDQNIDPNPPPPQGTNFGVSWAGVIPRENVYKDQFTLNVDGVLKTRHYRDHFGPQGDYSHMANHSNHYLTIGLVDLPRFKSAFYRGTYFWASRGEGVFSISGTTPDLHALGYIGFRCMWQGDSHGDNSNRVLSLESNGCPGNFVPVPGNSDYGTQDFCVMKYEAKAQRNDDSGYSEHGCYTGACDTSLDALNVTDHKVASVAAHKPWVRINRLQAKTECQKMGVGVDLISNNQWQTLARNIENVADNWASGSIGSAGGLNRGNSAIYSGVLPINNEANPCSDLFVTNSQNCSAGLWHENRRTHILSNNEQIWDIAGNVWEWVDDSNDFTENQSYGPTGYFSLLTDVTHSQSLSLNSFTTGQGTQAGTARTAKHQFGPSGNYTHLNSSPWGGLGAFYPHNHSMGVLRSGSVGYDEGAVGIFTTLFEPQDIAFANLGFRCVWTPQP